MWDCENCGTKAIAQSLGDCPACGTSRPKESAVAEPNGPDKSEAFPAGKSGGSATATTGKGKK